MLEIRSRKRDCFPNLILHFTSLDINCPIYRTLGQQEVKLSNVKKLKLNLTEVFSIKFEALLVVLILNVIDIDVLRLNNMKNFQCFYTVSAKYSKHFNQTMENEFRNNRSCLFWARLNDYFMSKFFA